MPSQLVPFLRWAPLVDGRTLRADALAGAVGALLVLPQGIAFATLAGLPPQYGLYCAMVPTAVAALFGSSLHTVSGPTNAVSLFVFAALSPLAPPQSPEYVSLALTLAVMAGVLMVVLGALRLGALVNFVSDDVIVGFTAGVAVHIVVSQLGGFLGIATPRGGSVPETLGALLRDAEAIRPWVVAVASCTVAVAFAVQRWLPRVPYLIVSLLAGGLAAYVLNRWLGGGATGIVMLEPLARALPPLSHPSFSIDTFAKLAAPAAALALVALTQTVAISRALALRSGQRIDASQEFIGQGLGNIAASFFSGFPASGSVNRSVPNFEGGARTPLASAFAALWLAALVLAAAPYASFVPLAAVAGSLFVVAWALVDVGRIRAAFRTSRESAAVIAITFVATLLVRIEFAVLAGVVVSLLGYLQRTARPAIRSLVPDPRHPSRKFTEVEDGLAECPQLKILRIEGSIYFGAIEHVAAHFEALRADEPARKHLLLMSKSINFVDMPGAELLVQEALRRRRAGGGLYLYSLRRPAADMLRRGGYLGTIGANAVYDSKDEAIAGVFARLDRAVCARCSARIFRECASVPPAGREPAPPA